MSQLDDENLRAQRAWSANARFWDERMAEGNPFFKLLVWPAVEALLGVAAGERLLDVACGNGLTSRLLARAGARVVAVDFAEPMILLARGRSGGLDIDYRVMDATDERSLSGLGAGAFDGALCNMALMDMADARPLMSALATLLRPRGRFVLAVTHPCFNNPSSIRVGESEDRSGEFVTTYSVKVPRYLTPYTQLGLAMEGQPVPHPYFHRSLSALIGAGLEVGFVLDGLEERAFPRELSAGSPTLPWDGRFSEIPPVLVARLRKP